MHSWYSLLTRRFDAFPYEFSRLLNETADARRDDIQREFLTQAPTAFDSSQTQPLTLFSLHNSRARASLALSLVQTYLFASIVLGAGLGHFLYEDEMDVG